MQVSGGSYNYFGYDTSLDDKVALPIKVAVIHTFYFKAIKIWAALKNINVIPNSFNSKGAKLTLNYS